MITSHKSCKKCFFSTIFPFCILYILFYIIRWINSDMIILIERGIYRLLIPKMSHFYKSTCHTTNREYVVQCDDIDKIVNDDNRKRFSYLCSKTKNLWRISAIMPDSLKNARYCLYISLTSCLLCFRVLQRLPLI